MNLLLKPITAKLNLFKLIKSVFKKSGKAETSKVSMQIKTKAQNKSHLIRMNDILIKTLA